MTTIVSTTIKPQELKAAYASCSALQMCLPSGLGNEEMERLDSLFVQRMKVKKGALLFRQGKPMLSLYAIGTGFFKTTLTTENGREQVTGFQMMGEMLGMDAISNDHYACNAIALEDSEVCPVPFAQLERLSHDFPALQHNLNKLLSREIARNHSMLLMMGSMNSDERLGAFLLNLSERYALLGYSPYSFVLRMRREEIASYLGLRLETVCRGIARLRELSLINISGRDVEIVDSPGLNHLVAGCNRPGVEI